MHKLNFQDKDGSSKQGGGRASVLVVLVWEHKTKSRAGILCRLGEGCVCRNRSRDGNDAHESLASKLDRLSTYAPSSAPMQYFSHGINMGNNKDKCRYSHFQAPTLTSI